jgi:UDP-GlcNAc:undecaprenyl-phosphate GlcNAc-1-phosphate transferase
LTSENPQQQPKPPGTKVPKTAIGLSQLTLLLVGIGWAYFESQNRLDDAQIPGFLIAMAISWWLTPEIRARAMRLGLVDKPGEERRIHKVAVPRLGGVAIYMAIMLAMCVLSAIAGRFPAEARGGEGGLVGIAVGGTLIFVLGLLDDLESVKARVKFLVQILAGCAAYSLGVRIKQIPIPLNMDLNLGFVAIHGGHPIDLGVFSIPITVMWLVGIANAVNLIDGMDGLAAGVSAISALSIWSVALAGNIDRPYSALAAAVLAGALLGFLRWNFNPARIFLGDSGAYLTGFILGAISIMGVIKGVATATVIVPTFLIVLLILFFPILDTSWAIIRRLAKGKNIFEADAGHIHHRLLQTGLSQKNVAYLIYGISAIMGLIATFMVGQQVYFLKLCAAVLIMAIFFAEVLNRHRQRKPELRAESEGGGSAPGQQAQRPNEQVAAPSAVPPKMVRAESEPSAAALDAPGDQHEPEQETDRHKIQVGESEKAEGVKPKL